VETLDVSSGPKDGSGYKGLYHRDGPLMALLGSRHWSRLTDLQVRDQGVELPLIQTLIDTGLLGRLRRLDLTGSRGVGDRAFRALAEAGAKHLEMLGVKGTNGTEGGMRALLRSERLPRLHELNVILNPTWIRQELLSSPIFPRLTTLTLPADGFTRA